MLRAGFAALIVVALAACTRPPKNLAGEYAPLTVADAQRQGAEGTAVRWGGALVEARPGQDRTCFEIVSRPLDREARPTFSDESHGRFIACAPGFYDPSVYAPGREITVAGALHGTTTRKVGQYDYRFPLVDATAVQLWEEPRHRTGVAPAVGISIGGVFGHF
jgi:outer membrane lipoprotein